VSLTELIFPSRIQGLVYFEKSLSCQISGLEYNKIKNIPKKTLDLLGNPNLRLMGLLIKYPGSASKNLCIFNPKNCFYVLGIIIWDVHSGSRIRIQIFSHPGSGSRIQESKRHWTLV
jgi:hypothetical protein